MRVRAAGHVASPLGVLFGRARPTTRHQVTNGDGAAGRLASVYDLRGIGTWYEYNDAGQMTRLTEDGGTGHLNRITEFTYNGSGQVLTGTAKSPAAGEGDQVTHYYYNTATEAGPDNLATTGLLARIEYPDHCDTDPGCVKLKYDLAGQYSGDNIPVTYNFIVDT